MDEYDFEQAAEDVIREAVAKSAARSMLMLGIPILTGMLAGLASLVLGFYGLTHYFGHLGALIFGAIVGLGLVPTLRNLFNHRARIKAVLKAASQGEQPEPVRSGENPDEMPLKWRWRDARTLTQRVGFAAIGGAAIFGPPLAFVLGLVVGVATAWGYHYGPRRQWRKNFAPLLRMVEAQGFKDTPEI